MAINLQPMYILASGGSRAMEQLDIQSNNLSNVSTPGFKKILMEEMSQGVPDNKGDASDLFVFPRFEGTRVDSAQGALKHTENPLDFAIFGNGFFMAEGEGGPMLTRNGHFAINNAGHLVDVNGNSILDDKGKTVVLDPQVPFSIEDDGTLFQEGEVAARLGIKEYESVSAFGDSYYKPSGKEVEAEYKLKQGFLESSNINATKAMVDLMEAQRRFDIYGNLIRSLDQLEQKTVELGRA